MIKDIPHSSLFATPESVEALDQMIQALPASERTLAYKYSMLAFNLAYRLAEQTEEKVQ